MKSEKGLSFLGTAILVVVIALIAFVAVYFTRMQVEKEKSEDIKTNMLLVKAKVKTISGQYTLDKKEENLVGTKLSDMKENPGIKEFLEKDLFNPDEKGKKYYVLNQQNLNDLDLAKVVLEENAYYIVEYISSEVYYTLGYNDEEGQIHYKEKEVEEKIKQDKEAKEANQEQGNIN